jgi:hypothetical protein
MKKTRGCTIDFIDLTKDKEVLGSKTQWESICVACVCTMKDRERKRERGRRRRSRGKRGGEEKGEKRKEIL